MPTVAECILDILVATGVKRIYGITGDSLNAFTDTIRKKGHIEWISTRHEEVAAFAAGAEAQLSGALTVCAGSCGPGNMHLINGLYDCHRNNVPVLAIAAQIPTSEMGGDYFQETHPERLFLECSRYCEVVTQPEQIPRLLEIAIQTAIATNDVAVLIIPGDISWKKVQTPKLRKFFPSDLVEAKHLDRNLDEIAKVLNKSQKVTIFGGIGCAGAHAELLHLAERLKAPIAFTLRGKDHIEYDNPFDVGLTGLLGFSSGYHALMDCDTLILLGTDFPYRQFYPIHATVIQVDIRAENIGRRTHVDYAIIGDVKTTLSHLIDKIDHKHDQTFLNTSLENYKKARLDLDELAKPSLAGSPIHPQYVAKLISDFASEDAIFTCDVGTPTIWAARYLKMNGKRRLLGSFKHGSMANALPQAIGAQLLYPDRQVVTLSGDGGISMLMGDLLTLKQHSIPVKVVVFNNSAYGFVELEMKASGILEYGTELENPNFAKMADAMGILGRRVENGEKLSETLQEVLNHQGPALIEVMVNRYELAMPPHISIDEVTGFGLYFLTAVINGKGNELIELARSNLSKK